MQVKQKSDTPNNYSKHEFHAFVQGASTAGSRWLMYRREVTLQEWVHGIQTLPPCNKAEAPAIVMNRFAVCPEKHRVRNQIKLLQELTGWFAFDVDGSGGASPSLKYVLFDCVRQLVAVWISPSGNGVKALGYWPEHRCTGHIDELRKASNRIYRELCGSICKSTDLVIHFDPAQGTVTQPVFWSSDPNILYRL